MLHIIYNSVYVSHMNFVSHVIMDAKLIVLLQYRIKLSRISKPINGFRILPPTTTHRAQLATLDQMNYAKSTQMGLPQLHASVISQTKLISQQILVDMDTTTNHYLMAYLTKKAIMAKATLAIQLMGDEVNNRLTLF